MVAFKIFCLKINFFKFHFSNSSLNYELLEASLIAAPHITVSPKKTYFQMFNIPVFPKENFQVSQLCPRNLVIIQLITHCSHKKLQAFLWWWDADRGGQEMPHKPMNRHSCATGGLVFSLTWQHVPAFFRPR